MLLAQSAGTVEYTDSIFTEGGGLDSPNECPRYDIKQSDGKGAWGNMKYPFINIAPRSILTRIGSTWLGPIYVWHLSCVQTNDLRWIKLLRLKLFDRLSVYK